MRQLRVVVGKAEERAEATAAAASPPSRLSPLVKLDSDGAPVLRDPEYDRIEQLRRWTPRQGPCELVRGLTSTERDRIEMRAAAIDDRCSR